MLKQVLESSLIKQVRDITVDFDPITTDSPETILKSAGRLVPLIKVANTVLAFESISYCTITIGKTFLPTLDLTFKADANFIDNDFPLTHSIVTVFIGNQFDKDFKTVKCDFTILSAEQVSQSVVDLKAELYVEPLKSTAIKSYASMSCIDAIKQVCTDIGLGLVSNIDATNDTMTWLQANETYDSFLQKHLLRHLWIDDDHAIKAFIDPWYRLNVIDVLTEMFVTPVDDPITIDYNNGEELDKPQKLILNNDPNGDNRIAQFNEYKLLYSTKAMKTTSAVNMQTAVLDMANTGVSHESKQASFISQTSDTEIDVFTDNTLRTALQITKKDQQHSNTHENFYEAATYTDWSQGMLDRVTLALTLPNTLNMLYVCKTVNVETYKFGERYERPIPEGAERAEENSGDYKQPPSLVPTLNYRLSGQFIITAIEWQFTKSRKMSQTVFCQRRMWPVLDIDKLK